MNSNVNEVATPMKIFLVDDNPDALALWKHTVESNDAIWCQRESSKVLDDLHNLNYDIDVIVTDLSMPRMNGITLTEQIRRTERLLRRSAPINIFWFTGWEFDLDDPFDPITEAFTEHSVIKIYKKPLCPTDLLTDVRKTLASLRIKEARQTA